MISKMVAFLLENKIESEIIVGLIEIAEAGLISGQSQIDEQAERRRAADRERKRNLRKSADIVEPLSSPSSFPPNPLTNTPYNPPKKQNSVQGKFLEENWVPNEEDCLEIKQLGFDDDKISFEIKRFRDWAAATTGQNCRKRDWNAAFRNWCRDASLKQKSRQPKTKSSGSMKSSITMIWVDRHSEAWKAWSRHKGKEPIVLHKGGREGQFFVSEFPS